MFTERDRQKCEQLCENYYAGRKLRSLRGSLLCVFEKPGCFHETPRADPERQSVRVHSRESIEA
jgi:hypothetical protein